MIDVLQELPANVFGYAIRGDLGADDYRLLRPALHAHVQRTRGGLNLLVDATEATGLSTRALWEEAKLQWQQAGRVHRVALIGPPLWTKPFIKLADMLRLGSRVETFDPSDRNLAVAWLAGVVSYQ